MRYPQKLKEEIRQLRSQGKTYGEIHSVVGVKIPKSTLSNMCSGVSLPLSYISRIDKYNLKTLGKARLIAREMNKIKREEMFERFSFLNMPIAKKIHQKKIGKIALAMLCLGEASKYNPKKRGSFSLGNSDPRIITLFLALLRLSFKSFDVEKIRCGLQCRADQNTSLLQEYWKSITGIPDRLFYKPLIDPRTKGKPTKKPEYRGVFRVYYLDTKVQLELESLADLVYNQLRKGP